MGLVVKASAGSSVKFDNNYFGTLYLRSNPKEAIRNISEPEIEFATKFSSTNAPKGAPASSYSDVVISVGEHFWVGHDKNVYKCTLNSSNELVPVGTYSIPGGLPSGVEFGYGVWLMAVDSDGSIYLYYSRTYELVKYTSNMGSQVWRRSLPLDSSISNRLYHFLSIDSNVIHMSDGYNIYKIDRNTGAVLKKLQNELPGYGIRSIMSVTNNWLFVRNGNVLTKIQKSDYQFFQITVSGNNYFYGLWADETKDILYAIGDSGKLYCIKMSTGDVIWVKNGLLNAGLVVTNTILYKDYLIAMSYKYFIVVDLVYSKSFNYDFTGSSSLSAISLFEKTGELYWSTSAVGNNYYHKFNKGFVKKKVNYLV